MIRKTKHATTNYKNLLPFITAADKNGGYLKCESAGYMPLTIEKLWYTDIFDKPVYSIMHWTTQNGDFMRDPDITFSVDHENKIITPLTFQNDFMGIYQEVFIEKDGKKLYSERLLKDLDSFLWQWLKNIEMQGFKAA